MNTINYLGDQFCDICIYVMQYLSEVTGISYGLINILFFIILQPLAIFCFFISTLCAFLYHNTNNRLYKIIGTIFISIGLLSVLLVLIPVIYGFLTMPI